MHRWSVLDLPPRKEIFLFDSFGLLGLKNFIIQDDKKILFGLKKLKLIDNRERIKQTKQNG